MDYFGLLLILITLILFIRAIYQRHNPEPPKKIGNEVVRVEYKGYEIPMTKFQKQRWDVSTPKEKRALFISFRRAVNKGKVKKVGDDFVKGK